MQTSQLSSNDVLQNTFSNHKSAEQIRSNMWLHNAISWYHFAAEFLYNADDARRGANMEVTYQTMISCLPQRMT
jgi:hypothetical protein